MIELKDVTKRFKDKTVLDHINMKFENGIVYGIHGTNGSGKTMLLRMIAGLIKPSEGHVYYEDKELHKDISFPDNTGIVIENMQLLPEYTAFENLKLLAKIRKTATDEDIKDTIRRVGLDEYPDLKVKKYSLGMKQRLNIAQAVFEKQNVILLDEPTNAIDDEGIQDVYKLIREEKERGAIIIIATHHLDDLRRMCDVTMKMHKGKLTTEENL